MLVFIKNLCKLKCFKEEKHLKETILVFHPEKCSALNSNCAFGNFTGEVSGSDVDPDPHHFGLPDSDPNPGLL